LNQRICRRQHPSGKRGCLPYVMASTAGIKINQCPMLRSQAVNTVQGYGGFRQKENGSSRDSQSNPLMVQ